MTHAGTADFMAKLQKAIEEAEKEYFVELGHCRDKTLNAASRQSALLRSKEIKRRIEMRTKQQALLMKAQNATEDYKGQLEFLQAIRRQRLPKASVFEKKIDEMHDQNEEIQQMCEALDLPADDDATLAEELERMMQDDGQDNELSLLLPTPPQTNLVRGSQPRGLRSSVRV